MKSSLALNCKVRNYQDRPKSCIFSTMVVVVLCEFLWAVIDNRVSYGGGGKDTFTCSNFTVRDSEHKC